MADFTVYKATGQISRSGSCPDGSELLQARDGEEVLIGVRANDAEQYVRVDELAAYLADPPLEPVEPDEFLAERPIIHDLDTVPDGTMVFVDGISHGECNDGSVEIASDVPGVFRVRLAPPFPWRPYEEDVGIT